MIDTVSAIARLLFEWASSLPFVKKRMSCWRRILVRRFSSGRLVWRYSQDLMAKKKAPVASWAIAMFSAEVFLVASCRRTQAGRAFCCFAFLSVLR